MVVVGADRAAPICLYNFIVTALFEYALLFVERILNFEIQAVCTSTINVHPMGLFADVWYTFFGVLWILIQVVFTIITFSVSLKEFLKAWAIILDTAFPVCYRVKVLRAFFAKSLLGDELIVYAGILDALSTLWLFRSWKFWAACACTIHVQLLGLITDVWNTFLGVLWILMREVFTVITFAVSFKVLL